MPPARLMPRQKALQEIIFGIRMLEYGSVRKNSAARMQTPEASPKPGHLTVPLRSCSRDKF